MNQALETFFSAWGMTDPSERRSTIANSMSRDATYADPRAPEPLTGIDAIAEYVAMFSANAPGWQATVVKSDATANTIRATVAFGGKGPDGADMLQHGQYFAEISDDMITKITGFVGTGEPA